MKMTCARLDRRSLSFPAKVMGRRKQVVGGGRGLTGVRGRSQIISDPSDHLLVVHSDSASEEHRRPVKAPRTRRTKLAKPRSERRTPFVRPQVLWLSNHCLVLLPADTESEEDNPRSKSPGPRGRRHRAPRKRGIFSLHPIIEGQEY